MKQKIAIASWVDGDALHLNKAYIKYVAGSGYQPVLVTQYNADALEDRDIIGLLIPGGIDLDPIHYGETNVASYGTVPERDAFERRLLFEAAETLHKPVFGICRGFQLIIREFLTCFPDAHRDIVFYQHINGHSKASTLKISRQQPSHFVTGLNTLWEKDSQEVISSEYAVNSMHHQAAVLKKVLKFTSQEELTGGLSILAATEEGLPTELKKGAVIIEAVSWKLNGTEVVGVQWHPEEMLDYSLLRNHFGGAKGEKKVGTYMEV